MAGTPGVGRARDDSSGRRGPKARADGEHEILVFLLTVLHNDRHAVLPAPRLRAYVRAACALRPALTPRAPPAPPCSRLN